MALNAHHSEASYQNIPAEMKARRQWGCWRYEERGDGKPTKPPYQALNGQPADVTNPAHWCSFEEAIAAAPNYDGIGFVFTKNDPFTGIDLDNTKGDEQAFARQKEIECEFNSYSEISPSGHGLHIIVKAKLPGKGRRHGFIEIYDDARFFTMTGNVYSDAPIAERQERSTALWEELGGSQEKPTAIQDQSQIHSDDHVIVMAAQARNGAKFQALSKGEWQTDYPSQSEADFAFIDIVAFHSKNRAQIARIFRKSALGQRKKAERHDYVDDMISKALNPRPVVAGVDELIEKLRPQLSSQCVSNVFGFAEFTADRRPPYYVWHRVFQQGCLYCLTALWGHGKTAIAITIAVFAATGRSLCGHNMAACRVLFLCGENPDDVRLRLLAAAAVFGISPAELQGQIYFTRRPFAIDDPAALKDFTDEAARHGPFGLCIIDTGPAHSSAADENDNRQMQALAVALRALMAALGDPATLVLMHPTKGATHDTMAPRGGGAFSGSIDGELFAWNEGGIVEFAHRSKFRGQGFAPMAFRLEPHQFADMADNFGEPAVSVVAVPTDAKPKTRATTLTSSNRIALDALAECRAFAVQPPPTVLNSLFKCNGQPAFPPCAVVPEALWRERAYLKGISSGEQHAKATAFRRSRAALIELGLICTYADHYWLPEWCSLGATAVSQVS
jgi:hypothetical protein